MLSTIIYILVGAFVLAMIFSKSFRDKVLVTLRIKSNEALDKATTPIEREKDQFRQLVAKARDQQAKVANVIASFNSAKKDLDNKKAAVDAVKADYKLAVQAKASEATLNDLAAKHSAAQAAISAQAQIVENLGKAAEEARKALDTTRENLKKLEADIQSDEAKSELAAALRTTGEAIQQAQDVGSTLSQIGEERKKIDDELERARAGVELAKGSKTDQEMAEIRRQAEVEASRKQLDAELSGTSK